MYILGGLIVFQQIVTSSKLLLSNWAKLPSGFVIVFQQIVTSCELLLSKCATLLSGFYVYLTNFVSCEVLSTNVQHYLVGFMFI